MSGAVEQVRHLIAAYRRFIKSSYRLADDRLRAQFEEQVDRAEVLVKGPYVTLAREFLAERTLNALVDEGVAERRLLNLHWAFEDKPLFKHQENALRAVSGGRNAVVKTGTASGKTEAFLLPVLSGILRAKGEGVRGTQAILLYPMNALANDQLERLRALIRDSDVPLTFALYTGESETVASTLGEPLAGHELTQRQAIRENPPDIILTNYKQLEFLLIRQADRALFTRALRFLVLDEIHSYRGALATEIACLIRRLKARCGLGSGELRCIGTSATVSRDHGGDEALAAFASGLSDESFTVADVFGEIYREEPQQSEAFMPPLVNPTDDELLAAATADAEEAIVVAERLCGRKAPAEGSATVRLASLLAGNVLVEALREAAREPRSYEELANALIERPPAGAEITIGAGALARLIEAYVAIGSIGDEAQRPLLRPKLHTFFHGVYDVGLCLNPECRTLVRDGSESCPHCGASVRPAVLCRTCGQDFVKVRLDPDDPAQTLPNDDFLSDDDTRFITSRLIGVSDDETEDETDGGESAERVVRRGTRQSGTRAAMQRGRLLPVWVDHESGRVFLERPADAGSSVREQWMLPGRGSTCPVCKSRYTRGDVLTLLRTGVASSVSVLSMHHLDLLAENERKLLVFADNRQEAAHQAGYMDDRHRQFAVRHAIEALVRDAGFSGIGLETAASALLDSFQRLGFANRRLNRDVTQRWTAALRYETASEFCRSTLQRVSLENLALVAVEYEFLDEVLADPRFVTVCERWGISSATAGIVVRAMLDFMRRRRAVGFEFYQQYVDDTKTPWRYLTEEPFSVSFPEHERVPVGFMLDRPTAARGGSGFKFDALVRDTTRGAPGGIAKLVRRATGLGDHADDWTREVIALLVEKEILRPVDLPQRVRQRVGNARALQIAPGVIRLIPAGDGWRCELCATWRPYRSHVCLANNVCAGDAGNQKESSADRENYYVRLYTDQPPRRLKAREHTAQIDENDRAKLETSFKEGSVDVLVCSPTLELGVNIGQLPSIVMRNAPPTPANYIQRAGRAGRTLRTGFVSTFCGVQAHDRHVYDDPAWLVRGEFRPPRVSLSNDRIVQRHIRALALEELNADFSWLMGDLLADRQDPTSLDPERLRRLTGQLREREANTARRAATLFREVPDAQQVVSDFPSDLEAVVDAWHEQVRRLHAEFRTLERILTSREVEQRRRARQRAYAELTVDRNKSHVLSYLADVGLLPSYQFPTDTFALDPGVADTPTLRRPAWIALFEFAPGNLVYANGHKLKSIRAFFNGGGRRRAADAMVERYSFCNRCGFAAAGARNTCPRCAAAIVTSEAVALLESFEAEENTGITSAEDARQRLYFERKENVLDAQGAVATQYRYEFVTLEYRERAHLLVTNWGKQARRNQPAAGFDLCSECGKHRPAGLTQAMLLKWDESHRRFCNGDPQRFVLGYEFTADILAIPIDRSLTGLLSETEAKRFARTLGKALVVGAEELLELEPDELAYMTHVAPDGGCQVTLYETAAGGAGYLADLAPRLQEWTRRAHGRLFDHVCDHACYRCLKSYRNQFDHRSLDKSLVRDLLFQLSHSESRGVVQSAPSDTALEDARAWLANDLKRVDSASKEPQSPIEHALLDAIARDGRLPVPEAQHEVRLADGALLTVPDFAFPSHKLAIFCDGFAYHGSVDTLATDATKRNRLQSLGWTVLTFWGRQILRNPEACVEQIRACFRPARQETS